MEQLRFTIPEIFSLIGVVQCVYILVYMLFRAGKLARAGIPFLYFFVLALAFFSDFSARFIADISPYYSLLSLNLWLAGPPIGVLLVIQVAQISKLPDFRNFWLLVMPFVPLSAIWFLWPFGEECTMLYRCENYMNWIIIAGFMMGALSLLSIWFHKNMLSSLHAQKFGKERYWVILSIILSNVFLLALIFFNIQNEWNDPQYVLARSLLGLAYIYLVTTSMFRIYPQSVIYEEKGQDDKLSREELLIAGKIEELLKLDKVYHEPSYSRSDLARELGVSETVVSRIINLHFQKSLPQLLNEYRVEDAKRLLKETDATITIIAREVGFNSMASFNRVFRDMAKITPTEFRNSEV
ncbi:MAG: helix-turn-helix domain-containing protein [Alphaproteobacteria bacterium]